jgi:rhodanese-related sulfurtransferase
MPNLEAGMAGRATAKTIDELLALARDTLPHRPSPAEALHAQADGALLVDIRGDDQRRDGLIPGAILVPRNSLEWRCDPTSQWRHSAITRRELRIILICQEGYQSSLAAATLQQLGLMNATDLDGGFAAWAAAGLPVIRPDRLSEGALVTTKSRVRRAERRLRRHHVSRAAQASRRALSSKRFTPAQFPCRRHAGD